MATSMCLWLLFTAAWPVVIPSENGEKNYLLFSINSSIQKLDLSQLEAKMDGTENKTLIWNQVVQIDEAEGKKISAMAFDCATQSVFYAVPRIGIYKVALDGTKKKTIAVGAVTASGLAVDWINRNLYWTDSISSKIMVSTITPKTTSRVLMTLLAEPVGIVVIPKRNLLIWTSNFNSKIEMSDLEGKNRRYIVIYTSDIAMLSGITANAAGDKLFWTSQFGENIRSGNITGSDVLVDPVDEFQRPEPSCTGIVEWNGVLYWRTFVRTGISGNPSSWIRAKNLKTLQYFTSQDIPNVTEDQGGNVAIATFSCPSL